MHASRCSQLVAVLSSKAIEITCAISSSRCHVCERPLADHRAAIHALPRSRNTALISINARIIFGGSLLISLAGVVQRLKQPRM